MDTRRQPPNAPLQTGFEGFCRMAGISLAATNRDVFSPIIVLGIISNTLWTAEGMGEKHGDVVLCEIMLAQSVHI